MRRAVWPCVPGTCLGVRADCFRALGGLDERFSSITRTSTLCLRAREAGWGIALVEERARGASGGRQRVQDRRTFVLRFEESRRQLIEKHHSGVGASPARAAADRPGMRVLGAGAGGPSAVIRRRWALERRR
jgi:hypothetical protein